MSTTLEQIEEMSEYFSEQAIVAEELGRLPDETAKRLRDLGVLRMLQPRSHGGEEAHPREFFEAVMALGARCGATGWVAAVVGLHPAEIAVMDPRVLDEIWGEDPDTWVGSPYTPVGIAIPTDGGYRFSGQWSFSSGCDHCSWFHLGGLLADDEGVPVDPGVMVHLVLPGSDVEILEDSWNVAGLKGSGSKDVVVRDKFVPEYRALQAMDVFSGEAAKTSGADSSTLYRMPYGAVFPNGITASIVGMCEGALAAHVGYQRARVNIVTGKSGEDPFAMKAIGFAAAEIAASRIQVLHHADTVWDIVDAGREVPYEMRAATRRDQVRAAARAVEAVDHVIKESGGSAMRLGNPMQRLWRDAHMGLNHAINMAPPVYEFYGMVVTGADGSKSKISYTI